MTLQANKKFQEASEKQKQAVPAEPAAPAEKPVDGEHADEAKDIELIKKYLDEYLGADTYSEAEIDAANKVKGFISKKDEKITPEEAAKQAAKYMEMAKGLAQQEESDESVEKSEAEKIEAEEKEAEEKEAEEKCESCQKKESELLALKGEVANFKEADRKRGLSEYVEKLCKDAKNTDGTKVSVLVTSKFKEAIGDVNLIKSKEEIDKSFKVFMHGTKTAETGSRPTSFSDCMVQTEKMRESVGNESVNVSDFSDCIKK